MKNVDLTKKLFLKKYIHALSFYEKSGCSSRSLESRGFILYLLKHANGDLSFIEILDMFKNDCKSNNVL